jgi:hypothetical protein
MVLVLDAFAFNQTLAVTSQNAQRGSFSTVRGLGKDAPEDAAILCPTNRHWKRNISKVAHFHRGRGAWAPPLRTSERITNGLVTRLGLVTQCP